MFLFPQRLDKFQRFVTRACPQPDPKNKEKKPSAPDEFPPHHPHPDPTLRPQRDLGLQLNRLPGNKLHPPPLRDRCQRQHCFHPRKRLPNTLPPPSAKGKIRKARPPRFRRSPKALRTKSLRLRKPLRITVHNVLAE